MALSDEVAKIHRWVLGRPTPVYGVLIASYSVGWVLALGLLLDVVPNPLFASSRILWALDLAVLTTFGLSHVGYVRRHGRDPFR